MNRRPSPSSCFRPALGASTLGLLVCTTGLAIGADDTALPPIHGGGRTATDESLELHSWEAPALTVQGHRSDALREEDQIGDYGQPRWTATRRFAEVRAYVIPKGQVEFEYWLFVSTPTRHEISEAKDAGAPKPKNEVKQQFEIEMGLGYHLQFDLYQVYVKDGGNGDNQLDTIKAEMRYAFADWGKIWGNPTLYAEWEQASHGADTAEFKLLLADELTSRWHWATNLVYEAEVGEAKEVSHEWNTGISYTVADGMFSVGAEDKIAYVTEHEDDGNGGFAKSTIHHWEVAVGPSIQIRTIPRMHLDLAEFIGLNKDASESSTVAILGWEF